MKEQDQYLSVIKFPAFVSITLIILSAVYFGFLYHALQEPGLSTSQTLIFGLLLLVLLVLVATWVATLMSTHIRLKARWMRLLSRWMLVHIYYPLAKFLATVTFSSKNILIESYLNFSNETVLTDQREISNSSILALLPHCLQKEDCTVRIGTDIIRCEECGGCDIAKIKQLVSQQKVDAAVATGGSLTKKLITERNPNVIVAVGCHRDMVDVVRDAWIYPIYAILDERVPGAKPEAKVNLASIEFAIKRFK